MPWHRWYSRHNSICDVCFEVNFSDMSAESSNDLLVMFQSSWLPTCWTSWAYQHRFAGHEVTCMSCCSGSYAKNHIHPTYILRFWISLQHCLERVNFNNTLWDQLLSLIELCGFHTLWHSMLRGRVLHVKLETCILNLSSELWLVGGLHFLKVLSITGTGPCDKWATSFHVYLIKIRSQINWIKCVPSVIS